MDMHTLMALEKRWRERLDLAVLEQNLHRALVAIEVLDEIASDIEETDKRIAAERKAWEDQAPPPGAYESDDYRHDGDPFLF